MLGAGVFILCFYDYNNLIYEIASHYGKVHKIAEIKSAYFTYNKFILLRFLFISAAVVCLVFLVQVFRRNFDVYGLLTKVFRKIKNIFLCEAADFLKLSLHQKIVLCFLFVGIIALRLFYFFKYPLVNDELASYFYFV
ncbi:MAG: hypothetical protein K2X86_00485, partial [Cytophagaceae bacterium]|nr:hypothetical protein [Cytophagaceae bacterium]